MPAFLVEGVVHNGVSTVVRTRILFSRKKAANEYVELMEFYTSEYLATANPFCIEEFKAQAPYKTAEFCNEYKVHALTSYPRVGTLEQPYLRGRVGG
jgi:hypothetical protein